jgi:hypothetical protein
LAAKNMYLTQDGGHDRCIRFVGIPVCPVQVEGISKTIHLETAVSPSGKRDNVDLRDNIEWIVGESWWVRQPLTGGIFGVGFRLVARISGERRIFDHDRDISKGDGRDEQCTNNENPGNQRSLRTRQATASKRGVGEHLTQLRNQSRYCDGLPRVKAEHYLLSDTNCFTVCLCLSGSPLGSHNNQGKRNRQQLSTPEKEGG